MQSRIGISAFAHGTKHPKILLVATIHTYMCQKYAYCYLSDVGALTTHVGSCDDLEIRLVLHHSAIVVDAGGRILDVDQRVLALYHIDLLLLFLLGTNGRFHVLMS